MGTPSTPPPRSALTKVTAPRCCVRQSPNVVGWAALLGTCLAAATAGVALARSLSRPIWAGAAFAAVPLGAVVLADRRRWAAVETSFGWGGSVEDVAQIALELQAQGVTTRVHPDAATAAAWREPVGQHPGGPNQQQTASLGFRNRDATRVRATLRAHGIHLPDAPW